MIPETQAAIYRVALGLDSFLVNGIPYGILHEAAPDGFLQKSADTLLSDLTCLEGLAFQASEAEQAKVREVCAELRVKCQRLIDLVAGMRSFRTLSLGQLRSALPPIPLVRGECVQLLQTLEACFRTPQPFYQSRPSSSTQSMNNFLANLEGLFMERWTAVNPEAESAG